MDVIEFREYCLGLGEVEEKMPFGRFNAKFDSLLVFYVCGHMFALVDIENFTYASIKADPEVIRTLHATKSSVCNPFNMSPKYWIEVDFGGDVSDDELRDLLRHSYLLVKEKYTRKSVGKASKKK